MGRGSKPGAEHPNWKGNRAGVHAGRKRARSIYPLGPCERCGETGTDRHHKDGNTLHNGADNIEILCRRCHMTVDGRMESFVAAGENDRKPEPPKRCIICGRIWKYPRNGRCEACAVYFRRHGKERTPDAVGWWHETHGTTWNQARSEEANG